MPKVSVIIPVYNLEKYLKECLDSAIHQTLEDIEIICVNDGSTDNSFAILEEYAKNDSRIKIINLKENVGVGQARNIAFKEITADYLMFLDPDDWYELNACELAYNQIVKNDNDFVLYRAYRHKNGNVDIINKDYNLLENHFGKSHIKYSDLEHPYFDSIAPWFKIHKVAFLKDNNITFDEGICYEDQFFWFKALLCNPDFSILNTPLIHYRKRDGSITMSSVFFIDDIRVKSKIFKLYKEYGNQNYIDAFVLICLKTLPTFKKFRKNNLFLYLKYYKEYRDFIRMIDSNYSVSKVRDKIDYDEYKKTLKYNLVQMLLHIFSENLFFMYNSKDKSHKIIKILGMKIKFKMNKDKNLKNSPTEVINIAMITDENYYIPTYIALYSMLKNKHSQDNYNISIITVNLPEDKKRNLEKLTKPLFNIKIIDKTDIIKNYIDVEQKRHVTKAALLKFYLPNILPNLDKVIYLDSDIIVQKSLSSLYNADIQNTYAGVVKDTLTVLNKKHMKKYHISNENYFNSGVLLLNLKKIREDNITEKLLQYKKEINSCFMDQDAFNAVIGHNVKYLSYKYNFLNYYLEVMSINDLSSLFNESLNKTPQKIYKNCIILHLGGKEKPWIYKMEYLSKLYKKYWKKSKIKEKFPKLIDLPSVKKQAKIPEYIFSVNENKKTRHKIITVLGIKIKIRKKKISKQ